MSTTSKSPIAVAQQALRIAQKAHLPLYSHKNSPKTYTQHQHLAILVLMSFFRTDYRGIEQYLHDLPDLRKALRLRDVPDHSTLAKAQKRLLARPIYRRLLAASVARRGRPRRVPRAALDSSGFATCHASHYYVRRRRSRDGGRWEKAVYRTYGKLGVVWDCSDHMILATEEARGPAVDVNRFVPLLEQACQAATIDTSLADVGYDSEGNHRHAREVLGVRSVMPARKNKTDRLPKGRWRRRMKQRLNKDYCQYGQRAQAETGNSMVKRRQSSTLPGRTAWSQRRNLRLMALTHNAMILYFLGTFRQSWSDPGAGSGCQMTFPFGHVACDWDV